MAAYAQAYANNNSLDPIEEAWIIRFPKIEPKQGEPCFEAKSINNIEDCFKVFLSALEIFKHRKDKIFKDNL